MTYRRRQRFRALQMQEYQPAHERSPLDAANC